MARDYAKSGSKGKPRNTRGHKPAPRSAPGSVWRAYVAGVLSGVFLSFIVYLTSLQPRATGEADNPPQAAAEATPPKPVFNFYKLLPEQTIEIDVEAPEVEPARDLGSPAAAGDRYVLQAGSFRQREDADRRRAQLILLGLEPSVQESNGDNGRWYRVYLGPYNSRAEVNRARALTAAQDIDTLLLKRGQP